MLCVIPNPHKNGKLTRSMLFHANPAQTFAVDAEQLRSTPKLLDAVETRASLIIRTLDFSAYLILVMGVVMSFFAQWWLFLLGAATFAAIRYIVQRSAGSVAKRAAMKSNANFLYLHSIGALWIVHEASRA